MDTPPVRVTRARAAKSAGPERTKIVTAAAMAKANPATATTAASRNRTSTAPASTTTTATKRKVRADDTEDENVTKKPARGRPRKVVAMEEDEDDIAAAPTKTTTRGRPKKTATVEETVVAKPTRGRPRKKVEPEPESEEQTTKKTVRSKTQTTAGALKSSSTTGKSAPRKVVKFQEPDKENDGPVTAKDPEPTSSMRGRPARRPASAATRGTKASTAKTTKSTVPAAEEKKAKTALKPLSPRKVTQMHLFSHNTAEESEDELAGGGTPLRKAPMVKLPIKLPSHLSPKKAETPAPAPEKEEEEGEDDEKADAHQTATVNNATFNPPALGMQASPAKRPPSSPFKDAMKSPARKLGGGVQLPGSAFKFKAGSDEEGGSASPGKSSLMQSAAKRPQSPMKGLLFPPTSMAGASSSKKGASSPFKGSVLKSPAKRGMPKSKALGETPLKHVEARSPEMKPLISSSAKTLGSIRRPSERLLETAEDVQEEVESDEDEEADVFTGPVASLKFPGRLSAVVSREADQNVAEVTDIHEETGEPDTLQTPEEAAEVEEPGIVEAMTEEAITERVMTEEPVVEEGLVEAAPTEQVLTEESVGEMEEPAVQDADFDPDETEEEEDSMVIDEHEDEDQENEAPESAKSQTPLKPVDPVYQLRAKDLDPCHDLSWESEDDLSPFKDSSNPRYNVANSPSKDRRATMGLSSLADQLGSWSAGSPKKAKQPVAPSEELIVDADVSIEIAEDEHSISQDLSFEDQIEDVAPPATPRSEFGDPEPLIDDIMVTDEDVALAEEANEMSLNDDDVYEDSEVHEQSFSDGLSEASQEYADENQVPVDPALTGTPANFPVTPARPAPKIFNTTTKIPLKPADHSTPSPLKKRSFSASRAAPKRPDGLTRSASVISYSPTKEKPSPASPSKETRRSSSATQATFASRSRSSSGAAAPATPSAASDIWSNIGTPARTPHKDVNPALLKGAVVFVDAHTSEGADASGIFIELLTQMGAKCLRQWTWNPNDGAARCGITHVVFKDGGVRTMEKVRAANGKVQCVGVSWVLDCEKENEWMDESHYAIDTSIVPRGGARRRKSMEPKALAAMTENTSKNRRQTQPPPSTTANLTPKTPNNNRRQSSLWMHTPPEQTTDEDAEGEDDIDWSRYMLTPVPKTPAPDAVARYAAGLDLNTPSNQSTFSPSSEVSEDATRELAMRTCPPKKAHKFTDLCGDDSEAGSPATAVAIRKTSEFEDLGRDVLGREKDERVRMRLMAARRKSLQFAPKVGSPLARAWI